MMKISRQDFMQGKPYSLLKITNPNYSLLKNRNMKNLFLTAIMLVCLVAGKAGEEYYSIGTKHTIYSEVLDEDRNIMVYTPLGYEQSKQAYPVLYLLDGGAHFHHASGIVQFLSAQGVIPQMIVVAITNVDRNRDFSPSHLDKLPTSGGADHFLEFLSAELMTFIDGQYRTVPYDILAGHSFGGTFATYALLEKPELFDAYIAMSPYLMWDDDFMVKEAEQKLRPEYEHPIVFYMTVGNEPNYYGALAEFTQLVETKSSKDITLTYELMQDENHGSIPHMSIYRGLEEIYSGWKLPKSTFIAGLDAIDKHYQSLSERYGYRIGTPEYTVNALGYYYLNNDQMEKSLKVFDENLSRFPESANVYDSYGEALEKKGQLSLAEANYSKAVEIAEKEDHPYLNVYVRNLERVSKKLTP
jgi:hypothetical protein